MKKVFLTILAGIIFITSTFASYTLPLSVVKKIEQVGNKIIKVVDSKYPSKKRKEIYWTIVDSIDGYIALHKLTDTEKAVLLCLKTFLLRHMGYKIWNPVEIKIVDDTKS